MNDEIKEAVWNCGGGKSTGPDGFTFKFIKHYWEIIRSEFIEMVKWFEIEGFLGIVLSIKDKLNYLEQPIPPASVAPEGQQVASKILIAHIAWIKGSKEEEGQSVSSYVLKMKGYIDNLECLWHPVTLGLGGLRASRKLKPGALSLYVGNGQREAVEEIGVFYLCLPSGVLNNCHYAPSITRGVIFVSSLYENGFINRFVNNTIQVSRNNMVYFSAILRDGIFEIDLSNSYENDSSMYAISNKRAKIDLDFALLWHCCLGQISKKRIKKLQDDGLLNSTDLRAFEKYVSFMSGKMERKSYTHQVKRDKDLLALIHTDVYGLFKMMSRQGASYFVTFTNDFSRYGYVYLLMHKHEVFKTFKVFQKEVENQLGKTIKLLRSDHEGEYISQEFFDHLKDHGIISHRTPPYTPQHNEDLEIIQEEDTHPSIDTNLNHEEDDQEINEPQSDNNPIHRSTRTHRPIDRMCLYIDVKEHELEDLDNEVWDLVELPSNGKTVGSKWLFKKKTDMDGAVHTYKACLVAKGYTQTPGINYEETFSPVADIRSIRILIAIITYYDYEIWQIDVKNAFLNGYLFEKVYMEQPEGFVNLKYPNRRYHMENSKRGSIPMQEKLRLSKSQGASTPAEMKRMQNVPYASTVGSIMYDVRCTRPDVAFAKNVTSRFQQNPGDLHWTTIKNILKYLRNIKDMFLVYEGDMERELKVSCYTDVGYLTDADDLKS
nr:retrotransposon protein, putative, Ty1-copia subclass [Tanacetum cinerariifolium]